jgi:hypothetical protein
VNRQLFPYFFEDTVTGESYLSMLNEYFYPLFCDLPGKDSIFAMQDGAPPHYALGVRNWFDQKFPKRWIGRRGPIDWPARSPDLTPTDYFMWGYIKGMVYHDKPRSLGHLKQSIITAFHTLDAGLCKNVCESIPERLQRCIDADGHQFEHLK